LRETVARIAGPLGIEPVVHVARISVAALMTTDWLESKLPETAGIDRVILPGYCRGDLTRLGQTLGVPVERGPRDLLDLPRFFRLEKSEDVALEARDIEILAEINHANERPVDQLIAQAESLRKDGADVIDLGCTPGHRWNDVGAAVRELVDRGHRVSIDSFDPVEVREAVRAGAGLVLSVDARNREQAADWGAEVVVIPDQAHEAGWFDSMSSTAEYLSQHAVPFRLDPILDPIGFGFARSLERYMEVRRRLPTAAILMGTGNLTEMTEVDSSGVNALLIAVCQELQIHSVLTTQVIGWARTSVAEIDAARRLMKHAVDHRRVPKHLDSRLVMLRAARVPDRSLESLRQLQQGIRDRNFRLFVAEGRLVAMNGERFVEGDDPFALFDQLAVDDPSHAFYLGWELMKASLALQLGKPYVQDEALHWGLATRDEPEHHRLRRSREMEP